MTQMHFGTPDQQAMLRRGEALYRLLRDDVSLSYYGRGMGVIDARPANLERLRDLVALQGVSNIFHVAEREVDALKALLTEEGYAITHYAKWAGGSEAIAAARALIKDVPTRRDIRLEWIDGQSSAALPALAEVSLKAGVLPISGQIMTGALRAGRGLVAMTEEGTPVSCAASAAFCHASEPQFGRQAWWGMLATDPARRGEKLALRLGAEVMVRLHEDYGFESFFTGVQHGNAASEAVCAKTGLSKTAFSVLTVVDPSAIAGGKMTK